MNKIRMLTEEDIVELTNMLCQGTGSDSSHAKVILQFNDWIHNLRHDNKALKEFLEILVEVVSEYDVDELVSSMSIYISDTFDECHKYTFLTICIACREQHDCRWDNTLKDWKFVDDDVECCEACPQIQMRKEEDQFPNHSCKCEECKKEVALVLKKEKKQ